jgi:hypothetical protein
VSISKILSRRVNKNVDYATDADLIEQLRLFEKQMGWNIFQALKTLTLKKADCLSITKEKPFNYFYARLSDNTILVRIQTANEETEFRLPVSLL